MIGWVHHLNSTNIHPVLCWYSHVRSKSPLRVATTTSFRWPCELVVSLDTEAEVAALLLRGYRMYPFEPDGAQKTALWLRRDHK